MKRSFATNLAIVLGLVAFLLAATSIGVRYFHHRSFDYFHLLFTLGMLAFLISLAGRKH